MLHIDNVILSKADLARLGDRDALPCATGAEAGTLKCEACVGSCGATTKCERTHYTVPPRATHGVASISGRRGGGGSGSNGGGGEIILQRTHDRKLNASYRANSTSPWTHQVATSIPDVNANLNSGTLPDGRAFLVSNPCPKNGQGHDRDPLVVSTAADGFKFDRAVGVMSCEGLKQCGLVSDIRNLPPPTPISNRPHPFPTENLLEGTDGLRRPPSKDGDEATHQ